MNVLGATVLPLMPQFLLFVSRRALQMPLPSFGGFDVPPLGFHSTHPSLPLHFHNELLFLATHCLPHWTKGT